MRSPLPPLLCVLAGLSLALPLQAEPGRGGKLHQAHCVKCHDSGVYTRSDRFVDDRAALGRQVRRCAQSQGLAWFDDELEDVIDYLDQRYYKFAP